MLCISDYTNSEQKMSCTKCGKTLDSVDELHNHIVQCAAIKQLPTRLQITEKPHFSKGLGRVRKRKFQTQQQIVTSPDKSMFNKKIKSALLRKLKEKKLESEDFFQRKRRRSFELLYNPQNHVRRREMTEVLDMHQCRGCAYRFSSISLLERHVRVCTQKDKIKQLHTPIKMHNREPSKKYQCTYCHKFFSYINSVKKHFKQVCVVRRDRLKRADRLDRKWEESIIAAVAAKEAQDEDRDERDIKKRKGRRKNHKWGNSRKRKCTKDASSVSSNDTMEDDEDDNEDDEEEEEVFDKEDEENKDEEEEVFDKEDENDEEEEVFDKDEEDNHEVEEDKENKDDDEVDVFEKEVEDDKDEELLSPSSLLVFGNKNVELKSREKEANTFDEADKKSWTEVEKDMEVSENIQQTIPNESQKKQKIIQTVTVPISPILHTKECVEIDQFSTCLTAQAVTSTKHVKQQSTAIKNDVMLDMDESQKTDAKSNNSNNAVSVKGTIEIKEEIESTQVLSSLNVLDIPDNKHENMSQMAVNDSSQLKVLECRNVAQDQSVTGDSEIVKGPKSNVKSKTFQTLTKSSSDEKITLDKRLQDKLGDENDKDEPPCKKKKLVKKVKCTEEVEVVNTKVVSGVAASAKAAGNMVASGVSVKAAATTTAAAAQADEEDKSIDEGFDSNTDESLDSGIEESESPPALIKNTPKRKVSVNSLEVKEDAVMPKKRKIVDSKKPDTEDTESASVTPGGSNIVNATPGVSSKAANTAPGGSTTVSLIPRSSEAMHVDEEITDNHGNSEEVPQTPVKDKKAKSVSKKTSKSVEKDNDTSDDAGKHMGKGNGCKHEKAQSQHKHATDPKTNKIKNKKVKSKVDGSDQHDTDHLSSNTNSPQAKPVKGQSKVDGSDQHGTDRLSSNTNSPQAKPVKGQSKVDGSDQHGADPLSSNTDSPQAKPVKGQSKAKRRSKAKDDKGENHDNSDKVKDAKREDCANIDKGKDAENEDKDGIVELLEVKAKVPNKSKAKKVHTIKTVLKTATNETGITKTAGKGKVTATDNIQSEEDAQEREVKDATKATMIDKNAATKKTPAKGGKKSEGNSDVHDDVSEMFSVSKKTTPPVTKTKSTKKEESSDNKNIQMSNKNGKKKTPAKKTAAKEKNQKSEMCEEVTEKHIGASPKKSNKKPAAKDKNEKSDISQEVAGEESRALPKKSNKKTTPKDKNEKSEMSDEVTGKESRASPKKTNKKTGQAKTAVKDKNGEVLVEESGASPKKNNKKTTTKDSEPLEISDEATGEESSATQKKNNKKTAIKDKNKKSEMSHEEIDEECVTSPKKGNRKTAAKDKKEMSEMSDEVIDEENKVSPKKGTKKTVARKKGSQNENKQSVTDTEEHQAELKVNPTKKAASATAAAAKSKVAKAKTVQQTGQEDQLRESQISESEKKKVPVSKTNKKQLVKSEEVKEIKDTKQKKNVQKTAAKTVNEKTVEKSGGKKKGSAPASGGKQGGVGNKKGKQADVGTHVNGEVVSELQVKPTQTKKSKDATNTGSANKKSKDEQQAATVTGGATKKGICKDGQQAATVTTGGTTKKGRQAACVTGGIQSQQPPSKGKGKGTAKQTDTKTKSAPTARKGKPSSPAKASDRGQANKKLPVKRVMRKR